MPAQKYVDRQTRQAKANKKIQLTKEIDGELIIDTDHLVAYPPGFEIKTQLSGSLISSLTNATYAGILDSFVKSAESPISVIALNQHLRNII